MHTVNQKKMMVVITILIIITIIIINNNHRKLIQKQDGQINQCNVSDLRIILLSCSTGRFVQRYIRQISRKTNFNVTWLEMDAFNEKIMETCNRILIPIDGKASIKLADESENLRKSGYKFLSSNPDMIRYLEDKINLQRDTEMSLRKYLPQEYDLSSAQFPCFFKKRVSGWSHDVYLIESKQHYETIINDIKIENRSDWFIQQAIAGDVYSALLLVLNGKIIVNYVKKTYEFNSQSKHQGIFITGGGNKKQRSKRLRTERVRISKTVLNIFEKFLSGGGGIQWFCRH
eukprot:414730_1